MTMARIRNHGLTILFLALFFGALIGQAFAGLAQENADLAMHGESPLGFWDFVTSSAFLVDVAENWQSEFLQFFVFIAATVWLVQLGSSESKVPGREGLGSDREQLLGRHAQAGSPAWAKVRGVRRSLYSNSLLLAMGTMIAFAIYLRQRGSPESKPVGMPHDVTAAES